MERTVLYEHRQEQLAVRLEEKGFQSYYVRTWDVREGTMYDVGSHTEFFLWRFTVEERW